MLADRTNGLMYPQNAYFFHLLDRDVFPGYMIIGPLHKLTTRSDPNQPAPFFVQDNDTMGMVDDLAALQVLPGVHTAKWSTHLPTKFPTEGMESGTYIAMVKNSRYFLGERTSKANAFFLQVGQAEPTTYPGNIGNCQICHRGVLSLDNLRHGLSVDHVEACKACHQRDSDLVGRLQSKLHLIHMRSPKYTADKRDCAVCHLTRESAVRPSLNVCSSCHPGVHAGQYFALQFVNNGEPSRFGNCAQSCHVDNLPKNHLLPQN
jgi:cytochrome c551/c552